MILQNFLADFSWAGFSICLNFSVAPIRELFIITIEGQGVAWPFGTYVKDMLQFKNVEHAVFMKYIEYSFGKIIQIKK